MPPSTVISAPVMFFAMSEPRKYAAAAMSSKSEMSPMGVRVPLTICFEPISTQRWVFIVPGSVYNKQCVGSNSLLKSYSGCGVQTPWDIISETERLEERSPVVSSIELDVVEEKIVKMLEERDMHIEEIIRMSGLPIRELTSLLLKLELLGLVKRLSGNYYGA